VRSVSDFERGRSFERQRIASILLLPLADKFPAAAIQLAFSPGMTAGAAEQILQRIAATRATDTEGTQAP
jgi:hypothetical protein